MRTAKNKGSLQHKLGALTAFMVLSSQAGGALAQTAGSNSGLKAPPQDTTLNEIIVTAQVRAENVQDVPVSMQVISGAALVQQNINSLDEVAGIAPSVHVAQGVATDEVYMRGIGSGSNPSFDQAVGTFIDDIYHGRSRSSAADFFDLDRIEILKGPQSTFFGNNAIAGAFNLTTNQPGNVAEGNAQILYGMHNDRAGDIAATVPLSEQLSARVAVHYDGSNGWLDNVDLGTTGPTVNDIAARVTILYKPSEDLDIKLKVQDGQNRASGSYLQPNLCPPPAPFTASGFCGTLLGLGLGGVAGLDQNKQAGNAGQYTLLNTGEYVLTTDYKNWGHTFTLVAGYLDYRYTQRTDIDGTPEFLGSVSQPENYDQYSAEFRVASSNDGPVQYLAGLYAQYDTLYVDKQLVVPFLDPVFEGVPLFNPLIPYTPLDDVQQLNQSEHSYAAFGSATWNVTNQLRLIGGLRYTWVVKSFDNSLQYGMATWSYGGYVPIPSTINQWPTPPTALQQL